MKNFNLFLKKNLFKAFILLSFIGFNLLNAEFIDIKEASVQAEDIIKQYFFAYQKELIQGKLLNNIVNEALTFSSFVFPFEMLKNFNLEDIKVYLLSLTKLIKNLQDPSLIREGLDKKYLIEVNQFYDTAAATLLHLLLIRKINFQLTKDYDIKNDLELMKNALKNAQEPGGITYDKNKVIQFINKQTGVKGSTVDFLTEISNRRRMYIDAVQTYKKVENEVNKFKESPKELTIESIQKLIQNIANLVIEKFNLKDLLDKITYQSPSEKEATIKDFIQSNTKIESENLDQFPWLKDAIEDYQNINGQLIAATNAFQDSKNRSQFLKQIEQIIKSIKIKQPLTKDQLEKLQKSANFNSFIKEITEKGINADINGKTALGIAALEANPIVVQTLLELGANPNIADEDGNTPLHIAALNGNPQIFRLLVLANANPDTPNKQGLTARQIVKNNLNTNPVYKEFLEILGLSKEEEKILQKYLKEFPNISTNINQQDREGKTLLIVVSERSDNEAVKTALDLGADPKISATDGSTVLNVTAEHNLTGPMKLILAKHPEVVDYQGKRQGATPLRIAVENARNEAAKILLDSGANPNTKGSDGLSAADILKQGIGRSSQLAQDVRDRILKS